MNTGDFLKNMAAKIGKTNDSGLTELLARQDIQAIDIPDELGNAFISELMSLEGAKNNSKVKAHFVAQALNGVDSELASAIGDFGLDAAIFGDEKDTYAKLRMFKSKAKELIDKEPEKASELEKANKEIHAKFVKLQEQLASTEAKHKTEIAEAKAIADNQVLSHMKTSSLKGLNWANKDQSEEVHIELANLLMSRAMATAGVKEVNEGGNIVLKMASDQSLKYYENGKEVDYESFKNKVLADSKLLAVTDPKPPAPPAGNPPIPPATWTAPSAKVAAAYTNAMLKE